MQILSNASNTGKTREWHEDKLEGSSAIPHISSKEVCSRERQEASGQLVGSVATERGHAWEKDTSTIRNE